jgi:hypothetical protein
LGLLIVDEEQRFGVSHKEKIKSMKQNIDVLTMTANSDSQNPAYVVNRSSGYERD